MVQKLTNGNILRSFILYLGELAENTLLAKDLAIETKQTLVTKFHNAYGGDKL